MKKNYFSQKVLIIPALVAMMVVPSITTALASTTTDALMRSGSSIVISETIDVRATSEQALKSIVLAETPVASTQIKIQINNVEFKQSADTGYATIVQDRTFVPIRLVTEGLGFKVDWNADTQTITLKNNDTTVTHKVGTTFVTDQTGKKSDISVPSFIDAGSSRTMVSVRLISEAFGAKVDYNSNVNGSPLVSITLEKEVTPTPAPNMKRKIIGVEDGSVNFDYEDTSQKGGGIEERELGTVTGEKVKGS